MVLERERDLASHCLLTNSHVLSLLFVSSVKAPKARNCSGVEGVLGQTGEVAVELCSRKGEKTR